jgi:hypothetical protein
LHFPSFLCFRLYQTPSLTDKQPKCQESHRGGHSKPTSATLIGSARPVLCRRYDLAGKTLTELFKTSSAPLPDKEILIKAGN